MASAMKHMVANISKLDKFEGVDFRRWQKNMHFLLSTMSVVYVLTTPRPEDGENAIVKQIWKKSKWENDDYVCRNIILNDFKYTLKHKKEELTLVELGSHLIIKESFRVQDSDKPKGNNVFGPSVVDMVGHNNSIRNNDNKAFSINETRDAIFDENRFSSVSSLSLRIPNGTEDIGVSKVSNEVPSGVTEEVIDEDVALWKEAINNEMDSIMGNNTWVLVDLPPGFRQKSGIDYFDTYGPIAFLNGELDEEVYMNQRWGFTMPDNEANVCKLIKSLYRLKQARKQWHQKFDEVVLSSGYLLNQADKCVDLTEEFLSSRFSIKDMREADVILVSTPMDTSEKFRPNNGQAVSKLEYTSNPSTQHWLAIHRVLKYLKKIMDYSLSYTGYPLVLEEYTDASWISNTKDNSSTNGWVFLLEGGAISWPSKKQTCTASLIIESEFVALAAAVQLHWQRLIAKCTMGSLDT
ncbi:zinc finger, CCHC-type containing protein [Tanacetum coccineum]